MFKNIQITKTVRLILLLIAATLVLDVGRYLFFPRMTALKKGEVGKTRFMEFREMMSKDLNIRQVWVPLSRVSPYLVKAVLISEDDKFWSHEGFDVEGLMLALEKDIKDRSFRSGGSTITQQLAKNLYLTPSKNPVRKLKEAILTWRLEMELSKERILEIYLNVAEWGDGIFGIEAAARRYFGKSASALGPLEASRLAASLPSPRRFNPADPSKYLEQRSNEIYRIMTKRGIIGDSKQVKSLEGLENMTTVK